MTHPRRHGRSLSSRAWRVDLWSNAEIPRYARDDKRRGMTAFTPPAMSAPMSFLDHIQRCNNADLSQFEPWFIGDDARRLPASRLPPAVAVRPDLFSHRDGGWYLDAALDTPGQAHGGDPRLPARAARARPVRPAVARGGLQVSGTSTPPSCSAMERAAVPWFGVRAFGPHMTGYVQTQATDCISGCRAAPTTSRPSPASSTTPWRAASRRASACIDNLIKECAEEAAIPRTLAEQAKAVSFISLPQSVRPAAQARRHDLLRSRIAGGFHTARK